MMDTFMKYSNTKPKLRNPILLEGLPGFGQVGRLVAEHLVKEFKGKQYAEMYSPHFPPQVMIQKDGLIDTITTNFFGIKLPKAKRDLLVVIGEAQASTITGQYEVCEKILDEAQEFKVKDIITIGGYATGKLLKSPKVFGAATAPPLVKEYTKHGVMFKSEKGRGGIVGASGLLLGLGALRDMKAVCLMGETPGHPLLIDAKAAEAILRVLEKKLGIKIEMGALDKRAKELEKFRLGLEKMLKKMMKEEQAEEAGEEPESELRYIG